jgi:hypothetical protein
MGGSLAQISRWSAVHHVHPPAPLMRRIRALKKKEGRLRKVGEVGGRRSQRASHVTRPL